MAASHEGVQSMPEEREVLEANQAFYDAFRTGDLTEMDRLWARDRDVAVIHPGWAAIHGRDAVMESWRGIIEGPAPPEIACDDPHAYVIDGAAFVICTEHLPDGDLVATNVFALEHGRWRLVHHQAGPAPITTEGKAERTVH